MNPGGGGTGWRPLALVLAGFTPMPYSVMAMAAGFNATARAVAGYGTAICKVPPLMICNPNEATSLVFDGDSYIGKNFVLTPPPGGNGLSMCISRTAPPAGGRIAMVLR